MTDKQRTTYSREDWFWDRGGYDQDFYNRVRTVTVIEPPFSKSFLERDIHAGFRTIQYNMTDGTVIKERA
jgi:hypothetical protein